MSEHKITVNGGSSVRLPTAGKYCDRDIVVTALGGGVNLPELTNPGAAGDLMAGKELIDETGTKVTGSFTIDSEMAEQDDLIRQIKTALQNKVAGGAPVIEPLDVAENGTYTVPNGVDGYNPVTVNVPIPDGYIKPSGELEITENGTHDVTAYQSVNVNVAGGAGDLPAGYRRCDFIRFTGKQLVDIGIICNKNTKIRLAFTREKSSQHYLYGVSSSDNTASVTAYLGGSWRFGNKSATKTTTTNANMIYSAVVDNSTVTLTGSASAISAVNEFETIGTLILGGCRNSNGTVGVAQFEGIVLFFVVDEGDEQVRHLVPVTDGTIYRFWDTTDQKFHDSITDVPLEGGNL